MNGRHTILTENLIEDIAKLVRAGNYIRSAAKICGVEEDTLHSWRTRGRQLAVGLANPGPCPNCGAKDPDPCLTAAGKPTRTPHAARPLQPSGSEYDDLCLRLIQTLTRADEEAKARAVIAWNRSIDSGDWRAAKEFLARRWPEEWGQEPTLHLKHEVIDRKELESRLLELLGEDLGDEIDS